MDCMRCTYSVSKHTHLTPRQRIRKRIQRIILLEGNDRLHYCSPAVHISKERARWFPFVAFLRLLSGFPNRRATRWPRGVMKKKKKSNGTNPVIRDDVSGYKPEAPIVRYPLSMKNRLEITAGSRAFARDKNSFGAGE